MDRKHFTGSAAVLLALLAGLLGASTASAAPAANAAAPPPAPKISEIYTPEPYLPTGGHNGAATGSQQLYNAKYIWYRMRKAGLTRAAAAGILGNLTVESGIDPERIESRCPYNWCGIGLAQWSFGRRTELLRLARINHVHWWDLGFQVWFMQRDMQLNYPEAWRGLKVVQNPAQAAYLFHRQYERSNDSPEQIRAWRGKYAINWYNRLLVWDYFYVKV